MSIELCTRPLTKVLSVPLEVGYSLSRAHLRFNTVVSYEVGLAESPHIARLVSALLQYCESDLVLSVDSSIGC